MKQGQMAHGGMSRETMRGQYWMMGLNILVSTVIMYLLMFEMIFGFSAFYNNLNMFFMALTMAMPMGILMLMFMGSMYADKKLNLILYAGFAIVLVLAFVGVRQQALIGDRQFVRSMIPHHAGAILMCNKASIHDAEIRQLCFGPSGIVQSQHREIEQMEGILRRL